MSAVKLKNVSKNFGAVTAVKEINFEIKNGELFFLLGPSGCGKTTILRMIAGFSKPDAGEIFFNNDCINNLPPYRRQTGMVFQNYALWPHMTVYQNVEYGLTIRDIGRSDRRKKVMEILSAVRMEEYAGRRPNQLSGGEQQRVALARALVIEPKVLLLDEPLANLDAKLRLELRQEIKRIQEELKITTLYVTHDQKEALALADRIAVMDKGEIKQAGSPREIYHSPADPFVANFVGETNLIKGKVKYIPLSQPLPQGERNKVGGVQIETGLGVLTAAGIKAKPDEEVTLSIRPESITLASTPSAGENRFKVKIKDAVFLGETGEYLVAVNKQELKIKVHHPVNLLRPGDEVIIIIPPEEITLLSSPLTLPSPSRGEDKGGGDR